MMSTRTTSPSSFETNQCAVVAPTLPAPTTVIFFRPIFPPVGVSSGQWVVGSCHNCPLPTAHCSLILHVLNNRARVFAGLDLRRAFHLAFQIVSDPLLRDGFDDAVDD